MARVCSDCGYYNSEGDQQTCPECGNLLQFTMLGPPNSECEEEAPQAKPAWQRTEEVEAEVLELPLGVRFAQIGAGIGFYFVVRRWGTATLALCLAPALTESDPEAILATLGVIAIVAYIVAALVAGAIAGAWTVNWVVQGIGVGAGLFVLPLLWLLFVAPESLTLYLLVVLLTTAFTVFGAYLGHLLVKPSRFIRC
jgi:hypothetical protein